MKNKLITSAYKGWIALESAANTGIASSPALARNPIAIPKDYTFVRQLLLSI